MPRIAFLAVVVAALVPALVALPSAQSAAPRRVEGRVVADDTGDPLVNAKVGFSTTAAAHATLTDGEGRFAIDTTPGIARLAVTKAGYARRDVALQAGRVVGDVRLARTAVITGRISYANGEAAVNVAVSAGVPVPGSQSSFSVRATSVTDDQGEFRLSGLSEERVVVAAQVFGARNVMRYFPGVESLSDAELLDLKAGNESDRIDLSLPESADGSIIVDGGTMFIATPPLRPPGPDEQVTVVRGRVVSATGGVVAGALVRLTQQARSGGATTRSDRDGRFAFADVVPGPFLIGASKNGFSSEGSPFGRLITVTATGADAELTLTPWGSVTGRVVDELGEPVQGAAMQLLRLQFKDGQRRLVSAFTRTTDDRGVFRIFGVAPGQYILSASAGDVSTAELPGYTRTFYPGVTDA
ncbi:MAG TPA: carboxypeptidase-like regulatory domain-containing protein, partial [Methylomirabilota bacterium]|nr:carboxypeptidase-like regulatory domain-containing protein [Methylomirabilota bacterium]